jgi:UvrD-like helicase family protein
LGERLSGKDGAQWLATRIGEVEDSIGRLPSIAIFVDGDGLIDGVVDDIRPLLATRNIPVAGCKEGKVVGDEREVRVFDVQPIRGLEFEAVFFVSVDRLAERIPDLFLRFVYVGVTRAATYLGVACEGALPPGLELLRPHSGRRVGILNKSYQTRHGRFRESDLLRKLFETVDGGGALREGRDRGRRSLRGRRQHDRGGCASTARRRQGRRSRSDLQSRRRGISVGPR